MHLIIQRFESITFEESSSLKIIGENVFQNHKIRNISIPSFVEQLGSNAFKTKHLINSQTIDFNKNIKLKLSYQKYFMEIFLDKLNYLQMLILSNIKLFLQVIRIHHNY